MNRRKFLAVAGGGVILAAGAGAWRISRTPDKALEPWHLAGSAYGEPRRRALSYAILAPNPHNRQPWLVDLSRPETVVLTVDTNRLLPHTDPFNRQITIGLGCFLELMVMAAAQDGYAVDLDLFPEGSDPKALDERPVAIARFRKDGSIQPDPLFDLVLQRRSVKEPYDTTRPVEAGKLEIIAAAASRTQSGFTNTTSTVNDLRSLTARASTIEMETPRTHKESVDLFRIGAKEVDENPDGIDITGPMIETLAATGLFTREASLTPGDMGFEEGRKLILSQMETSMAYIWLKTAGNTRRDQIDAGRDWLRVNLAVAQEGLSSQPNSQALQEYPEMKPLYDEIHTKLAPQGGTIQMLGRLGYHAPVPYSPRWSLEAKIVES